MSKNYIVNVRYNGGILRNSYLSNIPIIKYLISGNPINFEHDVTFFVGENGTGKSTIIEALAVNCGFNPEGGSKNFNFSTRNTNYELANCLSISRKAYPKDGFFLRAESFFNVVSNIEDIGVSGYGERSLHEQSHGESFLSLFENRFKGDGLYILDEPEAALSPINQMALLSHIHSLVKKNSQFIIATHSPILLSYPNANILQLDNNGVNCVSYENSELFKMYKQFLFDYKHMLKFLLRDLE